MAPGTIQKTISLFRGAFDGLSVDISLLRLEALGIMVHEAMTVQARSFHTPEHIFDLADATNPVQALAALFHDVVYHEIDQGFTPEIERVLAPYIEETGDQLYLVSLPPGDDRLYDLVLDVFGFEAGQLLSSAEGQNEFLSALLMAQLLKENVQTQDLAKIVACIEATIPFRGLNAQDETHPMVLERRLHSANIDHTLGLSDDEVQQAVKWAVEFSNRDVENFSERDTGRFLDNTWKLLPETNASLRLHGIYTIGSYRKALQKMEAFLDHLDPDTIFNQYLDEPPPGEYERMVALGHRNVQTARQYLGLKLLAIGILEALAVITGGDAPVALFMGALREGEDSQKMEEYLPDFPPVISSVDESSTLFGLLAFGRASASSFDLQNSPLSLYIFRLLGWENAHGLLAHAKAMFYGEIDASEFLALLPTELVTTVADACAELATTRRTSLRTYAESRRYV
jgi:hypothetical protein